MPCRSRNRNSIAERHRLPRLPERRRATWFVSGKVFLRQNGVFQRQVSILEPERIPEAAVKAVRLRQNAEYPSTVQASPYLRAAQAYMLISMPTGTSTIFAVFQAIAGLLLERDDFRPRA